MSSPDERPDDPRPEERADRPATGATSSDASGEREELQLAPIPAEGTPAPADSDRVFGRPSPTSPYARIVPPTGPSQDNSAARPPNRPESDGGSGSGEGTPTTGRSDRPGEPGQDHGHGQAQVPDRSSVSGRSSQPGPSQHGPSQPGPSQGAGGSYGSGPRQGPNGSPPSEEQERRIRGLGRWALVLGIAGLLSSVVAFPLGLALGIAAIVLGLRARRAGSGRMVVPGATPGLVLGAVATVFAGILTVTAVIFWDEVVEYQQCLSGANTQTARDGCQRHLEDRIMDRVSAPN